MRTDDFWALIDRARADVTTGAGDPDPEAVAARLTDLLVERGVGRAVFARAVAEPDSLAELPAVRRAAATGEEFECGDVLGVAWTAHQRLTGSELPPDPDPTIGQFWDFGDDEAVSRRLARSSSSHQRSDPTAPTVAWEHRGGRHELPVVART